MSHKGGFMRKICVVLLFGIMLIMSLFAFSDVQLELAHNQEFALYQRLQLDTVIARKSGNNKVILSELKLRDLVPTMNASSKNYYIEFNENIGSLELLQIQRERLEYIYERKQKSALRALVPNALSVATMAITTGLKNPLGAIISVVGAAASSAVSYMDAKDEVNFEYLQDTWELDDQEESILLDLGNRIYGYKCDIATELEVPTEMTLSTNDLENFIDFCNVSDARKRIVRLGTLDKRLEILPDYWRELALTTYELGDYEQTLEYIGLFEEIYYPVIYHDSDYAYLLMIKSDCINQLNLDGKNEKLEEIASLLLSHISADDWKSLFYVLSLYMEIYRSTGNKEFLNIAFELFPKVLIEIFGEYEEEVSGYISRDYVNQGLNEIETQIQSAKEEINTATKNYNDAKKNKYDKEGSAYKNIEEKYNEAENKLKQLEENKKEFKKTGDLMFAPSIEFISSMMDQYIEIAENLGKTSDFQYSIICDDFGDIVSQDLAFYSKYKDKLELSLDTHKYDTGIRVEQKGSWIAPEYMFIFEIPLSAVHVTEDGSEALFDKTELLLSFVINGITENPKVFDYEIQDASVEVTESLDSSRLIIKVMNQKNELGIKSPKDKKNLNYSYKFILCSSTGSFIPIEIAIDPSFEIAQRIEKNFVYTNNVFTDIGDGISGLFNKDGNK